MALFRMRKFFFFNITYIYHEDFSVENTLHQGFYWDFFSFGKGNKNLDRLYDMLDDYKEKDT